MSNSTPPQTWTPEKLRNKAAERMQTKFYISGVLAGAISWWRFSEQAGEAGVIFALIAMVLVGIGSLIKTLWVKRGQVGVYVRDKA